MFAIRSSVIIGNTVFLEYFFLMTPANPLPVNKPILPHISCTVVTSGYSSTLPPNIPVGTIDSYRLNDTEDLYIIDVKLFNDMKNLEHVYIIKNTDINELKALNISDE